MLDICTHLLVAPHLILVYYYWLAPVDGMVGGKSTGGYKVFWMIEVVLLFAYFSLFCIAY